MRTSSARKKIRVFTLVASKSCTLVGIAALLSTAALLGCKKPSSSSSPSPSSSSEPGTRLDECETLDGRAAADDCYEKVGVSAHKPGYCDRIVGPRAKNACFEKVALLADDPALCTKVDETSVRTACRIAIAKKRGNASVCASVERIEGQASCARDVAIAKKDAKICDGIAVVEVRTDCITRAASDPAACQMLADQPARDRCVTSVVMGGAGTATTEPACQLVADAQARDECWLAAARAHRTDDTLCSKIERPSSADRCHLDIAQNARSEVPCARIADRDGKQSCIADIAKRNSDDTLCAKLTDASQRASCQKDAKSTPASAALNALRKGVTRVSDDHYEITRAALDQLLTNQGELLHTARMVPAMESGKTTGIHVFGIRNDSALAVLGIENGDRLERINGLELASPEKTLEAYAQLRTTKELVVEMTRRGTARKMTYTIK